MGGAVRMELENRTLYRQGGGPESWRHYAATGTGKGAEMEALTTTRSMDGTGTMLSFLYVFCSFASSSLAEPL